MTDAKTGKTLTLRKHPAATREENAQEKRKRSGGRARQIAQREREQSKLDAATMVSPSQSSSAAPPRAGKSGRPGTGTNPTKSRKPARDGSGPRPEGFPRTRQASTKRHDVGDRGTSASQSSRTAVNRQGRTSAELSAATSTAPRRAGARKHNNGAEIFHVFAPCPRGLEEALVMELQALGFENATQSRAGCQFSTDWTGILRANLYSRLATRILVQVAQAPVAHEDDILELARHTAWERWFGPEQSLRVDTSAIRSPMQSLQYCNLRAKDGICDRLRDVEGARPDVDTVRPDARVHLFLDETSATLYLDTSGESLFKRGWRLDKGEAPLRENLAAGLLALADWDPTAALLDPFCGSGTILIEAAWIALGVPAGIWRPFGFERLRHHDARHWRDIKEDARARISTRLEAPLVGYDLDPRAIEAARANMDRARLAPGTVRFETGDARHVQAAAEKGWLVTNPPYGERLPGDTSLWADWAQNLKRNFAGWRVNVISSDHDLPKHMRLKPLRRYPLYNGALDCRLFTFDMVAAGYRERTRSIPES